MAAPRKTVPEKQSISIKLFQLFSKNSNPVPIFWNIFLERVSENGRHCLKKVNIGPAAIKMAEVKR